MSCVGFFFFFNASGGINTIELGLRTFFFSPSLWKLESGANIADQHRYFLQGGESNNPSSVCLLSHTKMFINPKNKHKGRKTEPA